MPLDVTLRGRKNGQVVRLPVTRVSRPDVTATSGHSAVSYEWSGFAVDVPARRLAAIVRWQDEDWELRVEVAGGGLRREGPVGPARPGPASWPGRWARRGVRLQPGLLRGQRLVVRVQEVTCHVTVCTGNGDSLEIEGWTGFSDCCPLSGLFGKPVG